MKKKSSSNIFFLLILAFMLAGCSDDETIKVYIPEARSMKVENFEISEAPYEVAFTVAVTGSDYATISGKEVGKDVHITLAVDEAKVTAFNEACKTNYPILPSNCYTLATEAVIPSGSASSNPVKIIVDAKGKIEPFDSYLLPISIAGIEGAEADIIQQTVYYLLSGAANVEDMPFADRSLWTVIDVSSEEASGEGANNGRAIFALDGDEGTFWHTQWSGGEPQPPHHVTIDMGEEKRMLGFSYTSRDFGRAWPQEITMETSVDGEKWEDAGTYSNLPASGGTEFRSYFQGFKNARYFRLTITAVYDGSWSTSVAEINAFCK